MKKILLSLIVLALASGATAQQKPKPKENGIAEDGNGPALTSAQQRKFLSARLPTGVITGTFGAFGSLLFAVKQVAIHTADAEIGKTELHSPFPDFYKPTWKELFDTIAAQTQSSWQYDLDRNYWVFAKPKRAKPFAVTIADKWTADDRDIYISYRPPTYPVGMDIYCYGSYSADDRKEEPELWEKIRNTWAIRFASGLKRDISLAEMKKITLAGVEALYFEGVAPRNGVIWRQWVFVKGGKAFVIVSSLKPDALLLLADVQAMINSFRVIE